MSTLIHTMSGCLDAIALACGLSRLEVELVFETAIQDGATPDELRQLFEKLAKDAGNEIRTVHGLAAETGVSGVLARQQRRGHVMTIRIRNAGRRAQRDATAGRIVWESSGHVVWFNTPAGKVERRENVQGTYVRQGARECFGRGARRRAERRAVAP